MEGNGIAGGAARQLAAVVVNSSSLEEFGDVQLKELRAHAQAPMELGSIGAVTLEGAGPTECTVLAELVKAGDAVLTTLHIEGDSDFYPGAGPEGAESLAEILRASPLMTELTLDDNRILDTGASAIAEALKDHAGLTKLDLAQLNGIGPSGATAVAEALKANTVLRYLDLSGPYNPIGPSGVSAIAEALKVNASLTTLGLANLDIDSSGATVIAEALKANDVLTTLNLSSNALCGYRYEADRSSYTAVGINAIAEALKGSRLTELDLRSNNVGQEGRSALRAAAGPSLQLLC
mmetsp:Transcript_43474/g.143863  ORF Transcript_43474/g.143863 Transcript_43474/m.143863 type:complete len:293 (+) Transcript_43474:1680-2558(+)